MDRSTAIDKIKKCLALSKSANEHEASIALRQAQKLMADFGIDHPEMLAAGATEEWTRSTASHTPARYEAYLASALARAYGCQLVFSQRLNRSRKGIDGGYTFVGVSPAPEICRYTFEVFRRKLSTARRNYISESLRRCGSRNKTARADMFCEGWVRAVRNGIRDIEVSAENSAMIDAYMNAEYSATASLTPRSRDVRGSSSGISDLARGYAAGERAKVHKGVSRQEIPSLEHQHG